MLIPVLLSRIHNIIEYSHNRYILDVRDLL